MVCSPPTPNSEESWEIISIDSSCSRKIAAHTLTGAGRSQWPSFTVSINKSTWLSMSIRGELQLTLASTKLHGLAFPQEWPLDIYQLILLRLRKCFEMWPRNARKMLPLKLTRWRNFNRLDILWTLDSDRSGCLLYLHILTAKTAGSCRIQNWRFVSFHFIGMSLNWIGQNT